MDYASGLRDAYDMVATTFLPELVGAPTQEDVIRHGVVASILMRLSQMIDQEYEDHAAYFDKIGLDD